jgi:hypothetical protein
LLPGAASAKKLNAVASLSIIDGFAHHASRGLRDDDTFDLYDRGGKRTPT